LLLLSRPEVSGLPEVVTKMHDGSTINLLKSSPSKCDLFDQQPHTDRQQQRVKQLST